MIQAYNSWENRVYELEGGLICKFYRPQRWSRAAIADEHRLLADLHAAHIEVAPALACGELEGITFATFPKLEGTHVPEDPSDDLLEELGRLLARLHDVGAARRCEVFLHLGQFFADDGANALARTEDRQIILDLGG